MFFDILAMEAEHPSATVPTSAFDTNRVRLTDSPASSPKIISAPNSPVRSVHLEHMNSTAQGPAPAPSPRDNFFGDDTSDEGGGGVDLFGSLANGDPAFSNSPPV